MDGGHADIAATSHLTMSDSGWERVRTQARVIVQLAKCEKVGIVAADAAAEELGGCPGDRYTDPLHATARDRVGDRSAQRTVA